MGSEGETERVAELQPDRYFLLGDAGSFFFDPAGDNDGSGSPGAAAEWARTQTVWPDLAQDLCEGIAAIVVGSGWSADQAAQENVQAAGFPEGWLERLPRVRNFARRWRLPRGLAEKLRDDPWKDRGPVTGRALGMASAASARRGR